MVKHIIRSIGILFGIIGGLIVYGATSVLCKSISCDYNIWIFTLIPVFFGAMSGWVIERLMRE